MKETLVMIPGTLCDVSLFENQRKGISDLVDCKVVDCSRCESLVDMAKLILSEIEGNFALLGFSYGGIIAFEIMRKAPERITKLILLNTNYKAPSEITIASQQKYLKMVETGDFRKITTDFTKESMLHPNHAKNIEIREKVLRMALNVGELGFINQVKSQLNRPDSTNDLPRISCPTLIVTGREDRICPPILHQEMAQLIPNSTLEIIEECGHLSTLEQPEILNETIRKWWLNVKNNNA
jgi:pimeloyl-ACP methyl ester carboxylesterase